jgi:ABC-type transport system involved in multi-copper enzyme maturation permease subunit
MIRTVASIAVVALVAWLAIKIVFGFAGGLIGLLISLAIFALKVALVVGLVYWLLTVFSPETARKMRDALRGESL